MAKPSWLGLALAVAQVTTVQVTAYAVGTTYKLTVGGVVISTIAAGSVNATATALALAWNTSTHPYCAAVTASASTDTVSLTADTAGVPFVVTSSVSGSTGTIGSATAATASSGPNHWDTAANWSTNSVPVNSDSVYVRNGSVPILWGLAQSAVTPTLLAIERTYSGTIGLPKYKFATAAGAFDATVPEYRDTSLAIGAAQVRIGENLSGAAGGAAAAGSALLKIDTGTTATNWFVFAAGSAADGLPPVLLKNTNAASTLKIYGASKVGVCWEDPADTGNFSAIECFGGEGTPQLFIGEGVTQATLNLVAGFAVAANLPTSTTIEAGAKATFIKPAGGTLTTVEKRGELVLGATFTVTNFKG